MKTLRFVLAALAMLPLLAVAAVAQESYKVRAGDVVRVEVLEDSDLNRSALVLPDGSISLPLAGSVAAKGRTLSEIQAAVTLALAPNFASSPTVYVSLVELAVPEDAKTSTIAVYVIGEVKTPGKHEIDPGTTILQFFAEIGGFTDFAATKRLQLRTARSGSEQVFGLDYDAIERGDVSTLSTKLADGDVIIVPQRRLFE